MIGFKNDTIASALYGLGKYTNLVKVKKQKRPRGYILRSWTLFIVLNDG